MYDFVKSVEHRSPLAEPITLLGPQRDMRRNYDILLTLMNGLSCFDRNAGDGAFFIWVLSCLKVFVKLVSRKDVYVLQFVLLKKCGTCGFQFPSVMYGFHAERSPPRAICQTSFHSSLEP